MLLGGPGARSPNDALRAHFVHDGPSLAADSSSYDRVSASVINAVHMLGVY